MKERKRSPNGRERDGRRERQAMAWLPKQAGFSGAHKATHTGHRTERQEGRSLDTTSAILTHALALSRLGARTRPLEKTRTTLIDTETHIAFQRRHDRIKF